MYSFDSNTGVVTVNSGVGYHSSHITYTADTNINAFQPSYPSPAEQAPKKEEVSMRTYQIEFNSSKPNEVVEGVHQVVTDNGMIAFYGEDRRVLRSFLVTGIFAYGVVADPEKLVVGKYLFTLHLIDNATKTVAADTYVITKSGDEGSSVYEFFTSLSEQGTKTRSELAIPYGAVKYVERVDPEKAQTAAVDSPRTGGRLMDTEDYGDAARPPAKR
jgi:hypothetical protein